MINPEETEFEAPETDADAAPDNGVRPWRIHHFNELDSTNRYASEHIDELADREAIVADCQTAGYGRLKRHWLSDRGGNLFASLVLKPDPEAEILTPCLNLTQYLAMVLCWTLEGHGVHPAIKWPNDVLVTDRKIAGILAETVICGFDLRGMVLGLGVNLNLTLEDLARIDQPATSLNLETGRTVAPLVFFDGLLRRFFEQYHLFLQKGFPMIRAEYLQRCPHLGREVDIQLPGGLVRGLATGVDEHGALLLVDEDGVQRIIHLGEVFAAD